MSEEQLEVSYKGKDLIVSKEIEEVAQEVMKDEALDLEPAKIAYVEIYPNISKTRVAKVMNCNRELKLFSNFDYIVEISGDIWTKMGNKDRYMIVYQQLLQILPTYKERSDEWKFKIDKPDLSTFSRITKKYGTDWYDRIKLEVSSIHDLDPDRERKIRLS